MFRVITLGTVSIGVLRAGMLRTWMLGRTTPSAALAARYTKRIHGSDENYNNHSPEVVHLAVSFVEPNIHPDGACHRGSRAQHIVAGTRRPHEFDVRGHWNQGVRAT
ncbi:MAG: hypothetical protein HYR83_09725 [Planctomycetes bacterium]|nr:hypothetical protein [Planctomycetota bacterium]